MILYLDNIVYIQHTKENIFIKLKSLLITAKNVQNVAWFSIWKQTI